jgi:phenylacetate-CoA ligase
MTTTTPSAAAGQLERLRDLAGQLRARDDWSREQLLAHQAQRLRALLRHAVARSPFYRETLGADAAERPLAELPTLPKATLMERFDQIVCDPRLRRGELEAHLQGPDPAQPFLGEYRVFTTSGSTGLRGIFAFTQDEFALWIAANLRMLGRIGLGPGTRLVAIGAPSPLHLTRQLFAIFQAGQQGAPRLSAVTPLPELVDALNHYQPEALIGYPTIAGQLADEQAAGRLHIRPRLGAYGAEPLTPDLRRRIRAAWDFEPANVYATTEAPIVAASTPAHAGLDIHEDLLLVEVVDEQDQPVPPGTPGFKVLVTNLVNLAQPLIRYEISDAVTLAPGPNPTGRPWRCLASVEGRSAEVLHLSALGGGEVAVHPSALGVAFAGLPDVRQYQVLHDRHGLHVRVVLAPGAPVDTSARLRRSLAASLQAAGALPPPVDVQPVAALQREPGRAAKLKLVASTHPGGGRAPAG